MSGTYSHQSTEKIILRKPAQPFVKWVGGKRSLLEEIRSRLPENFNNYFEPFAGGGALFFSLEEGLKTATLADSNIELIMTYRAIQMDPQLLIASLKRRTAKHSEKYYYNTRKKEEVSPIEIASRFLYLNKTCYNGLYRVNKSGGFNTPMGNYANPNIIQEENILLCHQALKKAAILYGDFEQIIPERGDFVYFDPPYHPTNELSFTEYTKENFTEKDQVRLRDFITSLHKKGVFIMLSNSKTKLIEDLYRARYFKQNIIHAPRFVNCKPTGRSDVKELLITNY